MSDIITCVGCGRGVRTIHGCYNRHHSVKGGGTYCFMSEQHAPITGHTDQAMISKAQLVAKLAMRIQDEDPHQVWRYLTAMPGELVQEMLMIALAGLDIEGRTVGEIWDWVRQLPDARIEVAG